MRLQMGLVRQSSKVSVACGVLIYDSKLLPLSDLTGKQESLDQWALTADFERAEILEPITFGNLRPSVDPQAKLIQVCNRYRPIPHAVEQVLPHALRKVIPTLDFRHSIAEYHTSHLVA